MILVIGGICLCHFVTADAYKIGIPASPVVLTISRMIARLYQIKLAILS